MYTAGLCARVSSTRLPPQIPILLHRSPSLSRARSLPRSSLVPPRACYALYDYRPRLSSRMSSARDSRSKHFRVFSFLFFFFFKRPMLKRRKWRENGCLLRIKGILCYIQRIAYVGMRNKRFTLDIYARGEFYWPGDKVSWIEQGFTLNTMDRIVASSRWNVFRVIFCK